MSSRVKESVIPPGGWHFNQSRPDGDTIKIEADSLLSLKEAVIAYRLQFSVDVGDVDREVEDYICSLNPGQCNKIAVVQSLAIGNRGDFVPLIKRIVAWQETVQAKPSRFYVNPPDARIRANICLSCSHNVQWHTSCQPCNSDAERKLFLLRGGRSVGGELDLFGCRIAGHDNRTAIWLRNETLIKPDESKIPDRCWMKLFL
jgi:hypothetical protein